MYISNINMIERPLAPPKHERERERTFDAPNE